MDKKVDIVTAPEDLLGCEIDGCRLESLLGCGSFGVVYLARHLMMDRLFALKILLDEFSDNRESIRDFFRESKVAAHLDHPNIVQAFKAGRTSDGLNYFVMEYVEGRSVEDIRVNTPELLSLEFLIDISIQLADALDYAWNNHQVVHRDIKPGNLLISEKDGKLKLADLGLAGAGSRASEDIMATPLYMPPEVASGIGSNDVTGDIYSFGVMFYELAAGSPPFTGDVDALMRAHIEEIPEPLISANPDINPELAGFIDTMLAKDPAARPRSWREIKERFMYFKNLLFSPERFRYQGGMQIEEPRENDLRETLRRTEKIPWFIIVLGILVLLMAGGVLIYLFS